MKGGSVRKIIKILCWWAIVVEVLVITSWSYAMWMGKGEAVMKVTPSMLLLNIVIGVIPIMALAILVLKQMKE
jgi:hypothetical protein